MWLPNSCTFPWTFHISTLGCKINQYESQAIAQAWKNLGGQEVCHKELPDVFLVNSCAITAKGVRDTRQALHRLTKIQSDNDSKSCLRILTGCAAQLMQLEQDSAQTPDNISQLTAKNKYFDLLIPPKAKTLLLQGPQKLMLNGGICQYPTSINPFGQDQYQGFSISSFHRARPILKIQDGCSHRCTYCIVPIVRGKSISRPAEQIVHEAKQLLQNGHREIILSGINLHQYGRDFNDKSKIKDFWDLVVLLQNSLKEKWQGQARFRISSLEPSQLNNKGLEVLQASTMLCPHIHLSLQHGSEKILKKMGRAHYKLHILQEKIQKLREIWQNLGLGADILMGFAGENDEDVQLTMQYIKDIALSYAHVFPYSKRPGTAALNFSDHVPHALKIERAAQVRSLIEEQKNTFLQKLLQEKYLHLVLDINHTSQSNNKSYKGVDAHYAPCQLQTSAKINQLQGIIKVKPLELKDNALQCSLINI